MTSGQPSQDELLALLEAQIRQREALREEIDHSVRLLKEAARELRRNLTGGGPPPAEMPENLPYRMNATRPLSAPPLSAAARDAEELEPTGGLDRLSPMHAPPPTAARETPQEGEERDFFEISRSPLPEPLNGLLGEPDGGRISAENLRGSYQKLMDELIQEDQMILLRMDGEKRGHRASPPEAQEAAPPERIDEPARPQVFAEPSSPALKRLMDYIRGGGAIRCTDPWEQICSAFVLRADGSAIFATDVFLNYVRKVLRRRSGAPAPGEAGRADPRVAFLAALSGALRHQRTGLLDDVAGLRIADREKLPETFEFERATDNVIRADVLGQMHELLQQPASRFYLPGEGLDQLVEFIRAYENFTRINNEEKRAAAMLDQLDLAPGERAAAPSGDAAGDEAERGPSPRTFLDESDELQDLNTFDFSPEDRKSILSQEERALSETRFHRLSEEAGQEEDDPFVLPEPEQAPSPDGPPGGVAPLSPANGLDAIPGPAGHEEEERSIKRFLKDIGVEWHN